MTDGDAMLRTILLIGLGAGAAACAGMTGPDVDFSFTNLGIGPSVESDPVVAVHGDRVVVTSELSAGDPCRQLDGELDWEGGRPTLRVRVARSAAGFCVGAIGNFRYTAILYDLPRSTRTIRIVHAYPRPEGWATRTFLRPMPY